MPTQVTMRVLPVLLIAMSACGGAVTDIGDDRREKHLLAAGEQDRTEQGQIGVVPG